MRHLGCVSWQLTSAIWKPGTVSQLYRPSKSRERDVFPPNPVFSICPWPQEPGSKPRGYQPEGGTTSPWSCSLFSLPRTGAWLPTLDKVFTFQKTNSEQYKLLFNSRYFIHLRDVIHFHVQILAYRIYRYWKKLLIEVAHPRALYFCDMPVAHNHHSPRSVSQMQQL